MGSSYGILLICIIIAAPLVVTAITCDDVARSLEPCMNYLMKGGTVPLQCCTGVKKVNSSATTKADRQRVCGCLKNATSRHPSLSSHFGLAKVIPSKCGVNIRYNISSPNPDCSKVT